MKCPYREEIVYKPAERVGYSTESGKREVHYAECYGKQCPFYDQGTCKRVYKEMQK